MQYNKADQCVSHDISNEKPYSNLKFSSPFIASVSALNLNMLLLINCSLLY